MRKRFNRVTVTDSYKSEPPAPKRFNEASFLNAAGPCWMALPLSERTTRTDTKVRLNDEQHSGVRLLKRPAATTQAEIDYAQRLHELIADMERPCEFFSSDYDALSYNPSAWGRQG